MAVAYDNDQEVSGNLVTSITTPAFTISGSDRVVIAGVIEDSTVLSSVSGAGASWAAVSGATATNGSKDVYQWRGIAPTTGSQTVTATFTNADGAPLGLSAISFTGADQTTPAQNGTGATGTSAAPSVTVAGTTADDFVVDVFMVPSGATADAGQTARANIDGTIGASTQDGADGGVMSWALGESLAWAIAASRIVAAGGAGPPVGRPFITRIGAQRVA